MLHQWASRIGQLATTTYSLQIVQHVSEEPLVIDFPTHSDTGNLDRQLHELWNDEKEGMCFHPKMSPNKLTPKKKATETRKESWEYTKHLQPE